MHSAAVVLKITFATKIPRNANCETFKSKMEILN